MDEGKLQKDGEEIHVIARHCENWSKLLRNLTSTKQENIPVLALSPRDEMMAHHLMKNIILMAVG